MAKDNLSEKANGCPALYGTRQCYVLGQKCERNNHENCPEYNTVVRPRGDAFYRATIQTITSERPREV